MHLELAIGGVGLLELAGLALQDAGEHQMPGATRPDSIGAISFSGEDRMLATTISKR